MTNQRAIGAVTAALSDLIDAAIDGVLPMTKVTNLRPGTAVVDVEQPSVNVYLYRAEPNASLRNLGDPTRAADGRLIRRPIAAWNLHYLLTCVGKEAELEPELLLGALVTGLTTNAQLVPGLLATTDAALAAEVDNRRFAAGSELAGQVELVRLTPIDLSVETLTQLWSSLTREHYALSVAYQAAVVLMSPDVLPRAPLPVGGRPSLALGTLSAPRLHSVGDSGGPSSPVLISSTLVLDGLRLRSETTQVRIGELVIDIPVNAMSAREIELPLSPLDDTNTPQPRALAPGVLPVQVRHRLDVSPDPSTPRLRAGPSSNVIPIVLRPAIVGPPTYDAVDAVIGVVMAPTPSADWEYYLLLNQIGGAEPRSLVLDEWSIDTAGAEPRVLFRSVEVPAGDWLVRIQVNGADSPLVRDANGVYVEPRVTVS